MCLWESYKEKNIKFFCILKINQLWNRNYLLRFRFWLLKSYGSGSGPNFWKVMVPVPTFEKVTVPVQVSAPYLDHKKQI